MATQPSFVPLRASYVVVIRTQEDALPVDPQRRSSLLDSMRAHNLAALAAFTSTDVLLLSGYWPVMGASIAILTAQGELHLLLPDDEDDLARATSDAALTSFTPAPLQQVTSFSEALHRAASGFAQKIGLPSNARIGTSMCDGVQAVSYQSINRFHTDAEDFLHAAFPQSEIVAADDLLLDLKSTRTPVELEQLRHACALTRHAFEVARHAIHPGRREDEVAAEIEAAFNAHANDGFERGRGYFFCMSGPNAALASAAFARTRRRVIEPGDTVMIHTNTEGDGAWTDVTRTYIAGREPSPDQQRIFAAIAEARAAALETIRPGAQASAADQAARRVLTEHGLGPHFKHAVGHGVGFAATDPNGRPRMHPASPDILRPGMTFNIEPAAYFDNHSGYRHCDVVACTASGREVLTDF